MATEDKSPVVRWTNADTGEVKEWEYEGVESSGWEWRATSLDLALSVVPSLVEAIDAARAKGHSFALVVTPVTS